MPETLQQGFRLRCLALSAQLTQRQQGGLRLSLGGGKSAKRLQRLARAMRALPFRTARRYSEQMTASSSRAARTCMVIDASR